MFSLLYRLPIASFAYLVSLHNYLASPQFAMLTNYKPAAVYSHLCLLIKCTPSVFFIPI